MRSVVRGDWRATLGLVSAGHFFSHFYVLTLPPLFPMLRAEFGLSNTELGLVVSVIALGGLLQAPVGGIVDRLGAKWVLVAGLATTAAGVALVGLGPNYPAILGLAVVAGLGQATFHPADYALIEAVTDPGVRGRAFSVHTFSGFAGFAAAPVVVGTLGLLIGWRLALVTVGAAGLVYAGGLAVALAPTYGPADGGPPVSSGGGLAALRGALVRPGLLAMLGFFFAIAFASKGIQTFTTVLAVDAFGLGESVGNSLLSAFFALGAVGVLVGGTLADRFPPTRVIAAGLLVGGFLLVPVGDGSAPSAVVPLTLLFAAIGFAVSLVTPARDRLVSELSAAGSTGRSFGVVFTGGTVGALVGPVVLGAVGDATSITVPFLVVAAVYLVTAGAAVALGEGWLSPASGGRRTEAD